MQAATLMEDNRTQNRLLVYTYMVDTRIYNLYIIDMIRFAHKYISPTLVVALSYMTNVRRWYAPLPNGGLSFPGMDCYNSHLSSLNASRSLLCSLLIGQDCQPLPFR